MEEINRDRHSRTKINNKFFDISEIVIVSKNGFLQYHNNNIYFSVYVCSLAIDFFFSLRKFYLHC